MVWANTVCVCVGPLMNCLLKTRKCVSKTRNFAFKMMNFAGRWADDDSVGDAEAAGTSFADLSITGMFY